MFGLPRTNHRPRNVRLDTLVRLRWLAVFGQVAAVLVVHFGLEFDVPIWPCLAVIALAALLNVVLRVGFPQTEWLEPDRAAYLLGFDIAELAALLYLTGGLENPFSFLLLGPVLISATALPPRMTLLLGVFAVLCATVLIFFHYQLPWESEEPAQLPETYVVGVWLSILLAIGYIGVYTWQVAEEARQLWMRWPRRSLCWRASSISRNSTGSPRRRRTNSARRSQPSPWSYAKSSARSTPIRLMPRM